MPNSKAELDRRLSELLRARGQRVTSQRLVIHRLLLERGQHLSAEQVHAEVADALPGTSLPTVYATLELFETLGVVRRVNTGGAVLFDPRIDDHPHTVCTRCGRVTDLEVSLDTGAAVHAADAVGFAAQRADVQVTGLCSSCQQADRAA